jgi:hypothetical protein
MLNESILTKPFFLIAAFLCGCGAQVNQPQFSNQPAPDVTGDWQGMTQVLACDTVGSGRCQAINLVRFSLVQRGSQLSGKYGCSYGSFECRHGGADSDGYVQWGDIRGSEVRLDVLLPSDLSSCLYNGDVAGETAVGMYRCYAGGALIEQGTWRISRKW